MKTTRISGRLLLTLAVAVLTSMPFYSCGDEEIEKSRTDNEEGRTPKRSPLSLQVTIDTENLTYEDFELGGVARHEPVGTVRVTIEDLPVSVEELKRLKLPNGMTSIHQSPYLQPLLLMAALNQLNYDKLEAKDMIDYVAKVTRSENRDRVMVHYPDWNESVTTFYKTEWDQVNQYKKWDKIRSWLNGAVYANNYTPEKPYSMDIELKASNSYTSERDYVKLWLTSTQLDTQRGMDIMMYDSDGNGTYDTFWTGTFQWMVHSLGEY